MVIYLPSQANDDTPLLDELTPREIVRELDKYVIGQADAKRAVAIALRNRIRRQKLEPEMAEEVMPEEHPHDRADRRRARPRWRGAWRSSPTRRSSRWKPASSPRSATWAATSNR